MRILLLTHAFNGLAQRLHAALREDGHAVSVELDIADSVTLEAVALWNPDVVVAPFLKRRIPEALWSSRLCLVVHPGPPGDRGPAALDHALLDGATTWGVTVLQADGEFDAGPVWASRRFAVRPGATKASLYRREVTAAAVDAVREALAGWTPGAVRGGRVAGTFRPPVEPALRRVDWARDDTATVLRGARAADSAPGLVDTLFGAAVRLFDLHPASAADLQRAPSGAPGDVVARRGPAVLRRTADGAVWIGQVRRIGDDGSAGPKLPVTFAFDAAAALPELDVPLERDADTWDELRYRECGPAGARVGVLGFDFHNGALGVRACGRLHDALDAVLARPTHVLVLEGGSEFFCNGLHLHEIEETQRRGGSAAEASMANIEAIDDVVLRLIEATDRLVVAALRGNAGAGGCFVALAADEVWAHGDVVQNPHYKDMGNLHGSEYWTYLLPRRLGEAGARELMRRRLPLSADEARRLGLVDAVPTPHREGFEAAVEARALALAADPATPSRIETKARTRAADEARRPLAAVRAEELAAMRRNFFGFDPSYHVARHHFVHRKPHAWTPRHLAVHRR